jgi:hypothetical protein
MRCDLAEGCPEPGQVAVLGCLGCRMEVAMTFWKAGTKTSRAAVLLAELGVRGVDLIVVAMVLLAVVLARRRWLSRQPGGSAERSGCMVGQNVQAAAADKRSEATFHDASAALHELAHVQGHLAAQDVLLTLPRRSASTRCPSSTPRRTRQPS